MVAPDCQLFYASAVKGRGRSRDCNEHGTSEANARSEGDASEGWVMRGGGITDSMHRKLAAGSRVVQLKAELT